MRLGVDFDNTIVCYERVFRRIAREINLSADLSPTKLQIRDFLRARDRENEWTEWQGYLYGPGMQESTPFRGAIECLARCRAAGHEVLIISHRTRHPFLGQQHDLHAAARDWIAAQGVYERTGLTPENVFLELTPTDKLARVCEQRCDWFIDDLQEFLMRPDFPRGVERVLFAPDGRQSGVTCRQAESWSEVGKLLGMGDLPS